MDKKNKHIDHLTPEVIKAYHTGNLSPEQMHQVEVLMLEHPLYGEGMEGIESIDSATLATDLDELTALVDQQVGSKVTPFWTAYRRAAAILLLLVTSVGLFYLLNDQTLPTQELSEVKETKTEAPQDSSAGTEEKEPTLEASPSHELDDLQKPETEQSKEVIEPTQATKSLTAETPVPEVKVFNSTEYEATDIQVAVPKEISLPMRTFDKSLDSVVEVTLASKAQRNNRQEVLSLSEETSRKKLDNTLLRRAFTPQNTAKSSDKLMINGVVTGSDDGLPLPQVSVIIKGTQEGTNTTAEGKYALSNLRPGYTLVFRFLGYLTQEVRVDTSAVLNIQLVPDATSLGEVVVTGIGLNDEEEEDVPTFAIAKPEGGYPGFNRYLRRNLKYPETAKEQKVRGKVTLEFDVSATGALSNFKIVKGLGFGCDEEAIRLVKEGPKWNPRTEGVDKRPVSSTVKIRVRFRP